MKINDLQGKLVAVLGYGVEGKAMVSYLTKYGVKPTLFDQKPWQEWPPEEQEAIKSLGINFIFGADCLQELTGFDVVFRSPGVPYRQIKNLGMDFVITSQTKWFLEHSPCKVIGVTGTKGKGTTSTLIYEMLKAGQINVFLTGNIGETQPFEILDRLKPDDIVVYEMSSFQLQDVHKSPQVAVVLMVTREHLDHHADIREYHDAKANITRFQGTNDICIYNMDYSASAKIGHLSKGAQYRVSTRRQVTSGCFVKGKQLVAHTKHMDHIFETAFLQLRGNHNLENIGAAILAAAACNIHPEDIQSVINNFKGLKHRLQFIGEFAGVKFYNDSFSTTPETAIAAIQAFDEPEIIILGGSSKHSDFTGLGEAVIQAKNIKAVILIGQEAGRIKQAIAAAGIFNGKVMEGAQNMDEIFAQIRQNAAAGDIVLLSPACASFGMFKNYKDRGDQFITAAQKF